MEEQETGNKKPATGDALRRGADIAARLLELAGGVLAIARRLPRDVVGRHVAAQLVRAGTSAGANYEEARAAESRADFVHKVRVATKEMREAGFWLRVVHRSGLVTASRRAELESTLQEANELTAILNASARTARERGV